MPDINIGEITEALNDKADRDLNNTQPLADYIVEWQAPTADNNYTWYRLYKSGWVEQGGHVSVEVATVTFPIVMADAFYNVSATGTGNGNAGASWVDGTCTCYNKSTTGMMIHSLRAVVQGDWRVEGMSAS